MPWVEVVPVVDYHVRSLCYAPYPGHEKHGCPNYGKKDRCPPKAPLIRDLIDLSKPCYAIYNVFDLGAFVEKMREKHPTWSYRQLSCCLYWQPGARRVLKDELKGFAREHRGLVLLGTAEACGVNWTETMKSVGIELQWPPTKFAYQIVLAGHPISDILRHSVPPGSVGFEDDRIEGSTRVPH
jgi:hypothetical protein